jgi:hypothetical protein
MARRPAENLPNASPERQAAPLAFASMVLLVPVVALAHHSEAAEFDTSKPIKVTGTVTKVEWMNPHIWFYVDVKDETGKVTTWGFSGLPPGMAVRKGFTKETMKIGETIVVQGFRAKDGSNNASGNVVTFPDGRDARIGQDQALNPTQAAPDAGKKP